MLPPGPLGGPILLGARARAERAYRDWKAAINDLWADKYKALLVEQATRACQEESACRQRLLDEHAVRSRQQEAACQEATRAAQRLLHKQAVLEREPSPRHMVGAAAAKREGAGGQRGSG